MLVGIDVCHYGPRSIVGFCATLNDTFTKYYSQSYYQKKGKEIGNWNELEACYKEALSEYAAYNQANIEHIIIFRDGVGDAMREQVKHEELRMLKDLLKARFPIQQPKVTLVIVNKRINQRFFQKSGNEIRNPPAGTIIDNQMIYSSGTPATDLLGKFTPYDFFLISQSVTQGCILPTHFFVTYDDAEMPRAKLQDFTYSLCYYYFNWSGSIKVPAPCQYAHKIAKYTLEIQAKPTKTENLFFL